jgi:hypothetical protein
VEYGAPMTLSLDKALNVLLVTCLDYFRSNRDQKKKGQFYKKLRPPLSEWLSGMAKTHAGMYPGWTADKAYAGYLIRFDAPMMLRVPYHVLPTFPSGSALMAAWTLSRAIRSSDDSTICLSGSNVLREVFDVVGDVDFFEYLKIPRDDSSSKLDANVQGTDELLCLRVALGSQKWEFPWKSGKPTGKVLLAMLNPKSEDYSTMKFYYAGVVPTIGVSEISNMIVVVDSFGNSAGLRKTFAPQEVPLVPIDYLPNQMADPWEMGRYIDWLLESIIAYRKVDDMCKCLKRSASLSRVLYLSDVTGAIAKLAQQARVLLDRRIGEMRELDTKLSKLTDDRSTKLVSALREQLVRLRKELKERGGPPGSAEKRTFRTEASRIAELLLSSVKPSLSKGCFSRRVMIAASDRVR